MSKLFIVNFSYPHSFPQFISRVDFNSYKFKLLISTFSLSKYFFEFVPPIFFLNIENIF